jgi:hypothetical protein
VLSPLIARLSVLSKLIIDAVSVEKKNTPTDR